MRGIAACRPGFLGWALFVLSLESGEVHAQIALGNQWPYPRLTTITPAGGKVGTTVEVGFAGSDLSNPETLFFSHPGIKATPIIPPPPKVDPKAKPDPKAPPPPPQPITKFSVAIDKNVPPGFYDVRFVNNHGVSNPRVFVIGDLNEVPEKEPNNEVEQAQKIDLGTTITGAVSAPTDVDYTVFAAKKGQRILITCLCVSLDSRLHPEMRLLDATGKQIAFHRPQPGNDGVLDFTAPADGDYTLRLNQFTYTQGGADYFYRLSFSSAPWIESVFPPMIEAGKTAQITIHGRNLPGGQPDPVAVLDGKPLEKLTVSVTAPSDPVAQKRLAFSGHLTPVAGMLDGFEYRLPSPAGPSNPVLFTFATGPVVLENDNNDTVETAQEVTAPCEVAGRIDKKYDRDWYVFNAKKGDSYIIEVFSHRLGAGTFMYLKLYDQAKKQDIVKLEENPNILNPLQFHNATRDPAPYTFTAPADGKYHVLAGSHVADLVADPTHVYRLRITKSSPDFRLIVMAQDSFRPEAVSVGSGGVGLYNVFVDRIEGFTGDVSLTMEGLPANVVCPPQVLSGSLRSTYLAVSAADNATPSAGEIKVVGTAIINGKKVIREARPATITHGVTPGQGIPALTRMDRSLVLAVRNKAPCKLQPGSNRVVASLGDKLNISMKLIRVSPDFKGAFQVAPNPGELPAGVSFAPMTFTPGKDDQLAVLTVAANTPPGIHNIIFRGFAPIQPDPKAKPVNTIVASPALELTVLPKQVANLSVDNANPTVKLGTDGVVVVKVARLFDYNDSFAVDFVLPAGVTGVSAAPITIPAGASEAKLTLKVAPNTPPAALQNFTIRAVAVINGNVTLVHETKINVTVVK